MEIKITKPGIFGADREIPVGEVVEVSEAPAAWAGRYEIVAKAKKSEKTAVTNPAKGATKSKAK